MKSLLLPASNLVLFCLVVPVCGGDCGTDDKWYIDKLTRSDALATAFEAFSLLLVVDSMRFMFSYTSLLGSVHALNFFCFSCFLPLVW